MFLERGLDFFSQDEEQRHANELTDDKMAAPETRDTVNQLSDGQTMESTPEALSNMRLEILPQLQYVQFCARIPRTQLKTVQCRTW